MELTLISSEMHLVWPDSRSNRRARAGGTADNTRTAARRSRADGRNHDLGAGDLWRRVAMAGDRGGRRGHGSRVRVCFGLWAT
uniref:Uncharacterized protein n=1 Tax=Arundo donax TaxID=35708 RepID=A0A0A9H8R1_ARUDO